MSNEESNVVDEIKARLAEEIPVEQDEPEAAKMSGPSPADIAAELRNLGRQFADTVKVAWASEERRKVESEIRDGVKGFVDELEKAIREVQQSPAAQKVKEEAAGIKTRAESGELSYKAKSNVAQGLRWMSEELGKLANRFTPVEKSPGEEEM